MQDNNYALTLLQFTLSVGNPIIIPIQFNHMQYTILTSLQNNTAVVCLTYCDLLLSVLSVLHMQKLCTHNQHSNLPL